MEQGKLQYGRYRLYEDLFCRHLADKWSSTYIAPNTKRRLIPFIHSNELAGIEHMILLDLLGAPRPLIRSSFQSTGWLFDQMVSAERRLAESGAFVYEGDGATTKEKWTSFFQPRTVALPLGRLTPATVSCRTAPVGSVSVSVAG